MCFGGDIRARQVEHSIGGLLGQGYCVEYRIAGNFREAEIFAIFAIKCQLTKICSRENFFLQIYFVDELRTLSTVCLSRRSSKSIENLS